MPEVTVERHRELFDLPVRGYYEALGFRLESENWDEETDALMIRRGYATIAMVRYDLNDYEGLDEIKKWEIKL